MLLRLIYVSKAAQPQVHTRCADAILQKPHAWNAARDITACCAKARGCSCRHWKVSAAK